MVQPSRRQLFGGGLLLGAAWVGVQLWGHRPLALAATPLGRTRRTLLAAFEILLPPEARAEDIVAGVESFLANAPPINIEQLRLALSALEHLGGTNPLRPASFSRRSREDRSQILENWRLSRVGFKRQIYQALHKTAAFSWYSSPAAFSSIGYDREFPT
jgi:hypothetical protein